MISIDRKAQDIAEVASEVIERKESVKSFIVVTIDFQNRASIQYSCNWHDLGVAASLCQAEFHHHFTDETTR